MSSRPKCAAIFLSGSFELPLAPSDWLLSFATIIAADGGVDHLWDLGVLPDLLLGDMDSVSPEAFAWAQNSGLQPEIYPRSKDWTDGELVIRRALETDPDEIWLFGVLGETRPDHFLGNIHFTLARLRETAVPFYLTDGRSLICPLHGPLNKQFAPKELFALFAADCPFTKLRISLIPVTDVKRVTTDGLLYPLNEENLPAGSTRAISNELFRTNTNEEASESFHLAFAEGDLLLVFAIEA